MVSRTFPSFHQSPEVKTPEIRPRTSYPRYWGQTDVHQIDIEKSTQAIHELAHQVRTPSPYQSRKAIGEVLSPIDRTPKELKGYMSGPQPSQPQKVALKYRMQGYTGFEGERSLWIPPPPNPEATDPIQDEKVRADYRVKFSILREAYPSMEIPEPRNDQSIPQIMEAYKAYVKRIHIDSSVEQNSTYLVILWLIIEIVGSRFFKFPMQGYFKNQFKYMGKYQMLLIELGERSYGAGFGEGWPVEARLLLMALFNGVIFVMVKSLTDKMSLDSKYTEEITEMINNYLTKGGDGKKETLRMAEEATSETEPIPQPEPADPLSGFGGIIGNLLGMFGGSDESKSKAQPAKATKKAPSTFGARTRKSAETNDKS